MCFISVTFVPGIEIEGEGGRQDTALTNHQAKSIRPFFPFGTQHQNYKYSVSNE